MHDPLLKRVVAVGGDTVELREGALRVNGAPVARETVAGPCSYAVRSSGEGGAPWREREPCLDFVETLDGRAYHVHCTPGLACEARWVLISFGPAGVRWDRVGRELR